MPKGLSETGFDPKRLSDILEDKRALAVQLFQDLLEPDDIVDTSDSSTIGRLVNLSSVPEAYLWELAQLVYSSSDPNSAVGIALDNLVQYGGIQRLGSSYSLVTGLFSGNNGITIPIGSVVGSNTSSTTFELTGSVVLLPTASSGVIVEVNTVTNSGVYTIIYSTSGSSTSTVTYTADSSTSSSEILNGLLAVIVASHPVLNGEIVDEGLKVTRDDIFSKGSFEVDSKLTITKVYNLGNLQAQETGSFSAEANSLNVIKTPVLGWDDVTNPLAASAGRDVETDEQLRLRFRNTKFERSTNILDSLYSALLSLNGVESVTVYENDTDIVNLDGLPPHSFMAVVLGGDSEDIAETIWLNKPAGITSVGNTTIEIIDSQNFPRDINYQTPNPVPIYITINLNTTSEYPANGADLIRAAIIEFARTEFGVGDDIIWSRLFTPINSVGGHEVESLFIGTTMSPISTDTIPIAFSEIGSFSSVNIVVNAT